MYMHTMTVILNMRLSVAESETGGSVLGSNSGCLEMSRELCSEACLLSLPPYNRISLSLGVKYRLSGTISYIVDTL